MMNFRSFKANSKKGNLIAVSENIAADLETPVTTFLKLAGHLPEAFLLESAEQEEKIGRYSFIGLKPSLIVQSEKAIIKISSYDREVKSKSEKGDLLEVIQRIHREYRLANHSDIPGFSGGFVGYIGYENVQNFEAVLLAPKRGNHVPDALFLLCEEMVIFDHYRKIISIVVLVKRDTNIDLKNKYFAAQKKIKQIKNRLQAPLKLPKHKKATNKLTLRPNMSKKSYMTKVKRIKEYIRAGDCIQVVLSQRFQFSGVKEDFQIYRALRSINPSPYMFYFRCGKVRLIGSSPEMLVKKKGKVAEVRPIAGTRPRGQTPTEDIALEEKLKKSPKEMAEHLMLVDLGRNDLGRVCKFDSIRVKNFAHVDRYSHVMHMESEVTGALKPNKNMFDLLKATFPAGTVSGAPKIRAMEIINQLEPDERGPYAGCLGYFSFNHDMDMCILIRTLVLDGTNIYLQAGAGIVKDSDPAREYQETMNKAKALMKAIQIRENF